MPFIFVNFLLADIDECKSPDTCPANSHCTNTEGAFKCDCKAGFQKTADGVCESRYSRKVHIQHIGNTLPMSLNTLHPNISMHILHTVLQAFP